MAIVAYEDELTLRAARDRYFAANEFGPDGGYGASWVKVELGPIPLAIPNSAARVRAVRYHDLHHVLTGYDTDILGELEISAWEIGAGCKDFAAAWVLNLGGLTAGAMAAPRRTYRAFVRGLRSRTLYGQAYEALLDRSVGDVRAEVGLDAAREEPSNAGDVARFALAAVAGFVVGMGTLTVALVVSPIALPTLRVARAATSG
ncbi:MAG: Coq4 family protein [Sandaracinaceae bacterium]